MEPQYNADTGMNCETYNNQPSANQTTEMLSLSKQFDATVGLDHATTFHETGALGTIRQHLEAGEDFRAKHQLDNATSSFEFACHVLGNGGTLNTDTPALLAHYHANYRLALTYFESGKLNEALDKLSYLMDQNFCVFNVRLLTGVVLTELKLHERAVAMLSPLVLATSDKDAAAVCVLVGKNSVCLGKTEQGAKWFEYALELDPHNTEAQCELSAVRVSLK